MKDPSTSTSTSTETRVKEKIHFDLSHMRPWREHAVILHDDDEHSQDQVIVQLMKALGCHSGLAFTLMRKVESRGKASVAFAPRQRAQEIAEVLRQIRLHVVLRQIN